MGQRWQTRPEGSNWGSFGPDDQRGRMNLVTAERRRQAAAEVQEGIAFCLSLPLDLPGGSVLNVEHRPPCFHPVMRGGHVYFDLPLAGIDPSLTDVGSDEAVTFCDQYSTHWDAFAHRGSLFDADGDGWPERVFYNGHRIADPVSGEGIVGELGATAVSAATMAETAVQGRGVMVDLRHHLGDGRTEVGYDRLLRILQADKIEVEEGDFLCLHTGLGQLIMEAGGRPDRSLRTACAVLDGNDPRLLQWITDSGVAAIAADNLAVERSSSVGANLARHKIGPGLPLHEHCLFKLGIHLGELWYLTELATWLRRHGRFRFFLTAPPLRLPGAAGAPATPVATV